jgi:hypothetical protein
VATLDMAIPMGMAPDIPLGRERACTFTEPASVAV